ncbi:MAG: alpha/beta fold hydrolase [Betaproteobacteria bacterium]|nr:alpha/beta fold hydrolase [Betaproteobacteria bacterium]
MDRRHSRRRRSAQGVGGDPGAAPGVAVVILVHGLWMRGWVLGLLRRRLARCGLAARVFSYPSLQEPLDAAAEHLAQFAAGLPDCPLHFVGHSLGGLVVLRLLRDYPEYRNGRVVLLGTPMQGSRVARRLAHAPWLRALLGPHADALTRPAPQADTDWIGDEASVAMIAGTRPVGIGRLVTRLPRPNDGTVAVAETAFPSAHARRLLPITHTGMLLSREAARCICEFLRHGRFSGVE